jgi:uncharacterized protein (TIGR02246 family)
VAVAQICSIETRDELAIHALLARYAWAFGTGNVEAFVGCFTNDATIAEDVFEVEDRWTGESDIRAMAEFFFSRPGFPGRQHHVSHVLIEGDSVRCSVRAFCFVTHCIGEPPYAIRMAGYYDDVVVKRDGRWLFQSRMIRDWSGPILKNFPGQDGEKIIRQRPEELRRVSQPQA